MSFDNCINDRYNDILSVKFRDPYFSTVVRYVHQELDNHLPISLLEISFLIDDNHGEYYSSYETSSPIFYVHVGINVSGRSSKSSNDFSLESSDPPNESSTR